MERDSKNEIIEDLLRQLIRENRASVGAATRTTHAVRAIYSLIGVILVTSLGGGLIIALGAATGDETTMGFGLVVIIAGLVAAQRLGGREFRKSEPPYADTSLARPQEPVSKKLGFEETGSAPSTDPEGRVIVKLKGGKPGLSYGVNLLQLAGDIADKLALKASKGSAFEILIRVRLRQDSSSESKNSILVETTDDEFIGWILEGDSKKATLALSQISSELRKKSPEFLAANFTFEVSARIKGWTSVVWSESDPDWRATIKIMELQIKTPFELQID